MIDLGNNPEAILTASDGTKFILGGVVLTLICGNTLAYLSSQEYESFDSLRNKTTLYALMDKQELVDLIRSKQYIIS